MNRHIKSSGKMEEKKLLKERVHCIVYYCIVYYWVVLYINLSLKEDFR